MILWGVASGSHDAAISVFEDDKLVFATDAERFSRVKNDKEIPENLLNYVRDNYGEPDKVYYYENPKVKASRRVFSKQDKEYKIKNPKYSDIYDFIYTSHHLSHASYGYYTSPFDECLVLVIDAIGEYETLTLWKTNRIDDHKDEKCYELEKIDKWIYPKSLGLMYSAFTKLAGWKPNQEEYIMMAASSIKKENLFLTGVFRKIWNENFNFHRGISIDYAAHNTDDIPASAQSLYEELFKQIIRQVYDKIENNGNLVFCGGCALNVKANQFLKIFDNVYIPTNPGDGGSSIGCVLSRLKKKISPSPYLGLEIEGKYPIDEIVKELKDTGLVGVAKGKAEFGPRALGNRSIFASPLMKDVKDKLNDIKGREFFRPFGAMILKEDLNQYYEKGINSPYMNSVFHSKEITKKLYPDILHLDGTTRLQIIDEESNLRSLMEIWKNETGCPMLINTSLNVKGQPLANVRDDVKDINLKVL